MNKTFDCYTIRLLNIEDDELYFQLIENNRIRLEDFISGITSKTKSLSETKEFIKNCIKRNLDKSYFPYVVLNTKNDEFIGFFDVKNIDWNIPKAEIGYFIDKNHTGKGLAKKALDEIVSHYFSSLKFSKLLLRIHCDNKASIKVAEKCGFTIEGTIRKDYKKTNGEIVDMIYYGKIN